MTMDIPVIPHDLIIEIFLRLPVQSLLRFRWVCKSCFNSIRDPSFVNMQFNYNVNHKPNNNPLVLIYHYDGKLKLKSYNIMANSNSNLNSLVSVRGPPLKCFNDSYEILGFCNGLLCMGVSTCVLLRERYIIWNPCTKEYKKASKRIFTGNDCCNGNDYVQDYRCYNTYGFGYDRTIDDYKLVKTTMSTGGNGINPETWVKVYTLGTNSWKTIRSSYKFILCSTKEDGNINGLFISGHLYYTAKKIWSNIIVSFDIAKEEYRQIPIPDIRINGVMNLGELQGCLCLLSSSTVLFGPWDVWMMRHNVENNMDVKEEYTWEKLYTINSSVQRRWSYALNTKLLRICKNGEILMVEEHSYKKKIVLYDPKSGEITVLHEVDRKRSVENYIESLLSLNSGTYLK